MERKYFWESPQWPAFTYDAASLGSVLASASSKRGELAGLLRSVGFEDKQRAEVAATTEEAIKTSEIEGEILDPEATRSSVASELGVPFGGARQADRKTQGVVDMLVDATKNSALPLNRQRLFHWHAGLFAEAGDAWVGRFRTTADGPERVVTGPYGNMRVLYEAPPAARLDADMDAFFSWFADSAADSPGLLKAGIAHLWFAAIHPFVDGNGRIARAIADLAFARADRSEHRYFSMSAQIQSERSEYYAALQRVQSNQALDITQWLLWFAGCYERSLERSLRVVEESMDRTLFWARNASFPFNERQRTMLHRFLGDWRGNLTSKKWAAMTGVSIDTASRDLQELVDAGILRREGAARSTHFVRA